MGATTFTRKSGELEQAGPKEARRTDPLLGKLLNGRFKILRPLGSGGMGRVYQAVQVPLDRPVAVKVLDPAYSEGKDLGFRKRFLLEASLTAQLRHPNTVTIFDYGRSEEGIYFIAMEYLEGRTLAEILAAEGPLPWPRALDIVRQVCRSLREAHRLGLVHRDLKPANVMILDEASEGEEVVKVLDFGLVKPFLPDAPGQELEVTEAGVLLGSPLYMAPEQAKNESDPRSDIYSLGVLMYQMLSGRTPFTGKQAIDVIVKHMRERPLPLHQVRNSVPPEVSAVVMRCLEKSPDKRFSTMDELMQAMRTVASNLGVATAVTAPQPSLPHTWSGERRSAIDDDILLPKRAPTAWIALLFALSIAMGGGMVFLVAQQQSPSPPTTAGAPPLPVPPPATVAQEAPPNATVTFHISSDPLGAQVNLRGRTVGTTPFELEATARDDGSAHVELTFLKEGYEPATVQAIGHGDKVHISQTLKKTSRKRR